MSWIAIVELITVILMTISQFFRQNPPAPEVNTPVLEQRIDSRPEFSEKPNLLVVYNFTMTEKDMELYRFIRNDAEMQKFVKQINLRQWNSRVNWLMQPEWQELLNEKQRPILVLQMPDKGTGQAKIVYFKTGDKLLVTEKLPKELQKSLEKFGCPDGTCTPVEETKEPVKVRSGILKWIFRTPDAES